MTVKNILEYESHLLSVRENFAKSFVSNNKFEFYYSQNFGFKTIFENFETCFY